MSCAGNDYGNDGCLGGLTEFGYLYSDDQPLNTEADYPYTDGVSGVTTTNCSYDEYNGLVKASGFSFIPVDNPKQM